jgi:hypothetical protein
MVADVDDGGLGGAVGGVEDLLEVAQGLHHLGTLVSVVVEARDG